MNLDKIWPARMYGTIEHNTEYYDFNLKNMTQYDTSTVQYNTILIQYDIVLRSIIIVILYNIYIHITKYHQISPEYWIPDS